MENHLLLAGVIAGTLFFHSASLVQLPPTATCPGSSWQKADNEARWSGQKLLDVATRARSPGLADGW